MMYRTSAPNNGAACPNALQVSQTKNVSIEASTCSPVIVYRNPQCDIKVMSLDIKVMSGNKINLLCDKNVALRGVSTCHTTSFKCLRHIYLSLRHSTTYQSMTPRSSSLSWFEHTSNW